MAYKLCAETKALGLYNKMQLAVSKYYPKGKIPANLQQSPLINQAQLQSEYMTLIKKKDMEYNSQAKSLIKDSMRISLKELGQIHYNYGYLPEANQSWIKSLDLSVTNEDIFYLSYQIAKAGFIAG